MMQPPQIYVSEIGISVQMGGKLVLYAALHCGVRSVDGGKAVTYGGCIKKRKNGTDVLNICCRKC